MAGSTTVTASLPFLQTIRKVARPNLQEQQDQPEGQGGRGRQEVRARPLQENPHAHSLGRKCLVSDTSISSLHGPLSNKADAGDG